MNIKKLFRFATRNYFISIFIAVIIFVGFVSSFKLFFTKPTYVYAKVKVGQGLWWASTQRPSWWFVQAIKPGMAEKDLVGQPTAQILSVRYYPWYGSGQYDVYVDLRLKVTGNKRTGTYSFNRSTIGVGSPVDLEFPTTQFSGTITELSIQPIKEIYITKTILLTKKNAYPWEYDAIRVGDKYLDGTNITFEILDKQSNDTNIISTDYYGNNSPSITEPKKYIQVKAKIFVQKKDNQLIFGEEQVIAPGKTMSIATPGFTFNDYVIGSVE